MDYSPLLLVAVCHPIIRMMLVLSVHAVIQENPEIYFLNINIFFVLSEVELLLASEVLLCVHSALAWFLGSLSSCLCLGCSSYLFRKELSTKHHCISKRS